MTGEIYVSVDVETAGPYPGAFSLLTIGACDVDRPDRRFQCTLKPDKARFDPDALQVTGLSLEELRTTGLEPVDAMTQFAAWLRALAGANQKLVFVGLNAPFDWSFINHYLLAYHGSNPFGFTALDMKAYYMGVTGCGWSETKSSAMSVRLSPVLKGDHDALHDALYQAELFRLMRNLRAS